MSLKTIKKRVKNAMIDMVDFPYRLATGQLWLPPYSLRDFVGGAKGFKEVGPWFLNNFNELGLINEGSQILEVGCGCGRIAFTLATNEELQQKKTSYSGMDIDKQCIRWCQKNITSKNSNFIFFQADLYNKTYNPGGKTHSKDYTFPYNSNQFDLIILASVFTHMLEEDMKNFLSEITRLLTEKGTAYISFFIYKNKAEAVEKIQRREQAFPHYYDHYAVTSEKYPEAAVAYEETFLRKTLNEQGLKLKTEPSYGLQDIFLLQRK